MAGGFRGRIFCTPATKDLCSLVLPDAAHIQEEDAREANRHGYSEAPSGAAALHVRRRRAGADRSCSRSATTGRSRSSGLPGARSTGSTVSSSTPGTCSGPPYARVRGAASETILFGGDLGRYGRPVLPDPSPVAEADVLLLESTYGDRLHEADDDGARLAAIVNDTVARGGKLIIPAFAIGRVEEVLYWLKRLEDEKRIPVLPVYRRQPDGDRARCSSIPARLNELDADMTGPRGSAARRRAFATTRMTTVASPQQSADLVASRQPAIVIASSGMATGGRVLRHLAATLPEPEEHGAVRRLPGGRHARTAARDGAKESSCSAATFRSPRASSASTRCRRTPMTAKSCAGCPASRGRRA